MIECLNCIRGKRGDVGDHEPAGIFLGDLPTSGLQISTNMNQNCYQMSFHHLIVLDDISIWREHEATAHALQLVLVGHREQLKYLWP